MLSPYKDEKYIDIKKNESIIDKSSEGSPSRFYQESQIDTLDVYFDYAFNDANQKINLSCFPNTQLIYFVY